MRVLLMSSAWKALSATESGCGKNTGSSIVWLRWKGETTLGRNFGLVLRITFSLWTWKKGSSKVRVWSSLTRLREVTATRNNFPREKLDIARVKDSKWGSKSPGRTTLRFHLWAMGTPRGDNPFKTFHKDFNDRDSNNEACSLFCN